MNTHEDEIETQAAERARWQWLDSAFVVGLLCTTPLVFAHVAELWQNPNLRFLPLLPVVTLALVLWQRGSISPPTGLRQIVGSAIVVVGSALIACGAWYSEGWFGLLAFGILLFGWLFARMGKVPWYRVAGWLLPLAILCSFPTTATSDWMQTVEVQAASSTSGLLDLISVANLSADGVIATERTRIPTDRMTELISNPYLFLSLSLLLLMVSRCTPLVGFLSLLTAPLWAWFITTAQTVLGVFLFERYDTLLLAGNRHYLTQAGFLLLGLFMIWLVSIAMKRVLSPFTNYSTTSGDFHKLYNKAVYWPAPDPLRKRRSREEELADDASRAAAPEWLKWLNLASILTCLAAVGLVIAGMTQGGKFN